MTTPVTRVPCVYGGHLYVATADLANPSRRLLPLYTKHGIRFDETPGGRDAIRNHRSTTLHRENIGPVRTEAETLAEIEAIMAETYTAPEHRYGR